MSAPPRTNEPGDTPRERSRVGLTRNYALGDDYVVGILRDEVLDPASNKLDAFIVARWEPIAERREARRIRIHQHVPLGMVGSRHRRVVAGPRAELQHTRVTDQGWRNAESRCQIVASRDEGRVTDIVNRNDIVRRIEVEERASIFVGPDLIRHDDCPRCWRTRFEPDPSL